MPSSDTRAKPSRWKGDSISSLRRRNNSCVLSLTRCNCRVAGQNVTTVLMLVVMWRAASGWLDLRPCCSGRHIARYRKCVAVRPVLRLIVSFFKDRKPLAVYKAEVFFCGLCDGGVGLRFSMMRVTDVDTYRASTSSASHTTIMVLYTVDPSARHPIWFRFVEQCAWIALRIPIV